eukprot:910787-Prymnesium_polylepis.1
MCSTGRQRTSPAPSVRRNCDDLSKMAAGSSAVAVRPSRPPSQPMYATSRVSPARAAAPWPSRSTTFSTCAGALTGARPVAASSAVRSAARAAVCAETWPPSWRSDCMVARMWTGGGLAASAARAGCGCSVIDGVISAATLRPE